jgi:sugar phosphate isomerase/epimerase
MTRREWLAAAAMGTFSAKSAVDMSRISAITDEIARTPADAIAFAKQYGMRWVELRGVPGARRGYEALPEQELRSAAAELREAGLGVSFLDAGLFKYSLPGTEPVRRRSESGEERARRLQRDGEQFERRMEMLARAVAAAKILGTDKVRVFTFLRVEKPMELLPRLATVLGPMAEYAARERVRLLVENEGSCNVATCAELSALMSEMQQDSLGINWDPHNGFAFQEMPFPDGYRLLPKARIGNVQIKGRSLLDEFPATKMDWGAVFKTMHEDGYRGCFGLETHIFGERQIEYSHTCMKEIARILA